MLRYIVKRALLIPPMILLISLVTLGVMHLAPGDPASLRYGLNPQVAGTARARLRDLYGLNRPFLVQYALWLKRVVRLDLDRSFVDDRPVREVIRERLPATVLLNALALGAILLLAIPIGVLAAASRGSLFDRASSFLVFLGYSAPTFWVALLLIMFFGVKLRWFPISGLRPWYAPFLPPGEQVRDILQRLVLPVAATAFGGLAGLSRYSRSSMLQALNQDYIRTARAKGLKPATVVWKHALKNALLPVVTILGLSLPSLIGGSVIFETIFSWPGMGRLGYNAIMNYDYPVVMGVGLISSFLTLAGILVSDVVYAWVDPRIRYE